MLTVKLPEDAPTIKNFNDLFTYSPSLFAEAIVNYKTLHEIAIPPEKKRLNFEHVVNSTITRTSDMEKLFKANGNKG